MKLDTEIHSHGPLDDGSALESLLTRVREYLPATKLGIIRDAYAFAAQAHEGQLRRSGEPFLEHPLHTAMTVTELWMDAATVAAALLHDVPEDCAVPMAEIEARFGKEVARLVDGTTKLGRISFAVGEESVARSSEEQAANLRKMLVAMAQDIRVVIIKLADRLHNLQTLEAMPADKRRLIAQETMDIYAPLAHRLGMWRTKWALEDLAFRHLNPDTYHRIARLLSARRASRERYIEEAGALLVRELKAANIEAEVTGRPKHIYSIYTKMEKYAAIGKDFSEIYDLHALRILVNNIPDCYTALGVVHNLWRPIPGQFDDYIANSKENMYQSIHTTVIGIGGRPLEVQIRTYDMHHIAEYGVAAHWRYKEGGKGDVRFEEKLAWLRQLLEWHKEVSGAEEFMESVKTDLFPDQVFVFTPKGEIKDLPTGSTPIDFAYLIHTDLGNKCIGAKVNGRLVSLNYQLQHGDAVEILTTKGARGPSRDWLNLNLGYVKTSHARSKIRQWFKRQERSDNIQHGKEMLEKELKRLGLSVSEEEVAHLFKHDKVGDFLAALGCGEITIHQVSSRLVAQEEPPAPTTGTPSLPRTPSIQVLGVGDLLTQMARCCNPVPGDDIIGYITRTRGVTVHRKNCVNVVRETERERLVPVSWGRDVNVYPVAIQIEAWDRVGLVRDVSTTISDDKVNIASISARENGDRTMTIHLTVETTGLAQLSRVMSRLEGVKGILSVNRRVEGAK
ncbi:MAG: bifunctional (p)ppGpp synthetase/guanosine-3',5'-bis(diphosphate) 3'-pyrophosphohydrolase [Chloroflexi bacterium]|nr:bifunctional (p)ppGpp synthetase/guanosine-3',5'-bis(diphosphate) 3'-pyrophosphohydrolase [Chloroflexota bacterium]